MIESKLRLISKSKAHTWTQEALNVHEKEKHKQTHKEHKEQRSSWSERKAEGTQTIKHTIIIVEDPLSHGSFWLQTTSNVHWMCIHVQSRDPFLVHAALNESIIRGVSIMSCLTRREAGGEQDNFFEYKKRQINFVLDILESLSVNAWRRLNNEVPVAK